LLLTVVVITIIVVLLLVGVLILWRPAWRLFWFIVGVECVYFAHNYVFEQMLNDGILAETAAHLATALNVTQTVLTAVWRWKY